MPLVGIYDSPTPTTPATARVGRVARWSIGPRFKTATSSAVDVTSLALDQTTVARNAMPAISDATASNGCLASTWMNTTARDTLRRCTACHSKPMNPQKNNMKITSNTTKATLQPYSQDELNEIAANVLEYQRKHCRDYTYTNERGQIVTTQTKMTPLREAQLLLIAKDLFRRGTHQQEPEAQPTLQVIGQTIC